VRAVIVDPDRPATFCVLYVCTGNICRSPFAEVLTAHLVAQSGLAGVITVSSAGTGALVGHPMHPASRVEAVRRGVPEPWVDAFAARQLDPRIVGGADLILGATPAHRAEAVRLWPRALPVAFSLLEFARLAALVEPSGLPADPVDRGGALVAAARAQRGMAPGGGPDADAIPDPYGGPAEAHAAAAALVATAVHAIVRMLVPATDSAGRSARTR
jgi:protein-tyrosine phosphatase